MPFQEIKFQDLVFDEKVQTYCANPQFKCPFYGHSWACPPEAPFLEDMVSSFKRFFLIYYEFNLRKYVKKIKEKHPNRSENRIKNSFYRKEFIRDYLEKEIIQFLENYEKPYKEKLILWDGHCRLCFKEGEICTYDDKQPCRYPEKLTHSMTGAGINTTSTVKNLDIDIEWPPMKFSYRFGLVCFK